MNINDFKRKIQEKQAQITKAIHHSLPIKIGRKKEKLDVKAHIPQRQFIEGSQGQVGLIRLYVANQRYLSL